MVCHKFKKNQKKYYFELRGKDTLRMVGNIDWESAFKFPIFLSEFSYRPIVDAHSEMSNHLFLKP